MENPPPIFVAERKLVLADCQECESVRRIQRNWEALTNAVPAPERLSIHGSDLARISNSLILFHLPADTSSADALLDTLTKIAASNICLLISNTDNQEILDSCFAVGLDWIFDEDASEKEVERWFTTLSGRFHHKNSLADIVSRSSLLDAFPDLIIEFGAQGQYQEILTANTEKLLLPFTREQILGKTVFDFFPEESAQAVIEMIQSVLASGQPMKVSYPLEHASRERIYEAYLTPIDGRPEHVLCIARDVTSVKGLAQRVSDTESVLEAVLDAIPLGVFWKSVDSKFLGMNRYCMDWMGLSQRSEYLGKTAQDFAVTQDFNDRYEEEDHHVLTSGESMLNLYENFETESGTIRFRTTKVALRDSAGNVIGTLGSFEDISEPYRLQKELEDEHEISLSTQSMAKIGSWEYNTKTRDYKWSDELYRILEVDPSQSPLTSASFPDFYRDGNDATVYLEKLKHCFKTKESAKFEFWLTTPNNTRKRILHAVRHIRDGVFRSSMQDITKLHERNASLQQSRAFLEGLMNTLPYGVFWKDKNSVYMGCNEVLRKALQLENASDIVGRTDYELGFPEETATNYRAEDQQIIASGDAQMNVVSYVTSVNANRSMWRRGSKVPLLDAEGNIIGILGTVEDITREKLREEESQRTRQLLLATQEISKIGGWEFVAENGDLHWSDEVYRIYGLDPSIKPYADLNADFWPAEEYRRMGSFVRACLKYGESFSWEAQIKSADDVVKWVRCSGRPLLDGDKQTVGVSGTIQDITEEKRQQAEQRSFEARVQHAQKLESLGVMAGGIAHDFNNLLVSMMGYGSIAQGLVSRRDPVFEIISNMVDAAQKAAELTKQMLAYSGKGKFVTENIDINELIGQMTNILRVTLPKGAVLSERFDEGIPNVGADKAQISQVIMNLISNAGEAMEETSGRVSISTKRVEVGAEYCSRHSWAASLEHGSYVCFEVSDSGCGMDEETLQRIFDPFFTTKFAGRGLGLAAVLGIVRGHKGAINASSRPGEGTNFIVLLPASTSENAFNITQQIDITPLKGSALVVDDEPEILDVAQMMLSSQGMEVDTAIDGIEGLRLFAASPHKYDVVILDMTMPHLSGQETLVRMREINPDAKVMLSSGYSEEDATAGLAPDSLAGFIQKPFLMKDFVAAVRGALN